ncbi:TPA: transposase, partial [Streptococcus suis]
TSGRTGTRTYFENLPMKNKYLTLSDRNDIQIRIEQLKSFSAIAAKLEKKRPLSQKKFTEIEWLKKFCNFHTVFKTFLKDKDKVLNAPELPYSYVKLEATNNLIKIIKRNAFGFRNFENFKKRILIALNIKKERTNFVLSRC